MRTLFVRFLAVVVALTMTAPGRAQSQGSVTSKAESAARAQRGKNAREARPEITTLMYLVNRPESIASFREHAGQISIIAPQTFTMDAQGFVGGEVPPEVLAIAQEKRVAVMPLVTNRGFNQPLMHTVLDSAEGRERAIRYLEYYALRDGYLGFQFDYENIHYGYRDKFTVFFREAAREFHRHGLLLSAAVVGKINDERDNQSPGGYDNWSGVYDYASLGKVADFLSIMAYAEHGRFSDPGPIASYGWVQKIAQFTVSELPAKKISLGVPFYGTRWDAAAAKAEGEQNPAALQGNAPATRWTARSMRYADTAQLLAAQAASWDEEARSPHLSLDDNGKRSEVWFENAHSLRTKLALSQEMGFPGISAWVLGQEDPAFWETVAAWRVRHPRPAPATGPLDKRAKRAARLMGTARGK